MTPSSAAALLLAVVGLAACSPPAPPAGIDGSIVGVVFVPQDTLLGSLGGPPPGSGTVFAIPEDEIVAYFEGAQYLDHVPTLDELAEGSDGFLQLVGSIAEHGGVTAEVGPDGTFQIEGPGSEQAALCYSGADPERLADPDLQQVEMNVPGCRLVDPAEAPRLQIRTGDIFNVSLVE